MIEASEALAAVGLLPDSEIEPATAALQLARLGLPDANWLDASQHLSVLARDAAEIGAVMAGRSPEAKAGALSGLIHARHNYRGDSESYDDLDNANLIRVIERRRGLPVALGLLWLHCIRAAGWDGHGIDFPGHFLLVLKAETGGGRALRMRAARRLLVDPFDCGAPLGSAQLLEKLRRIGGEEAALEPGMTRPMATREVLLRLQRNLVQRRLMAGELAEALGTLEGMLLFAPGVVSSWLDAGEINRALGRADRASLCLQQVLEIAPDSEAARIAQARLDALDGPGRFGERR